MSTDLVVPASAELLAEEEARKRIALIKQTVATGATDEQLDLFLYTARTRGLDPLLKQIHWVPRRDGETGERGGTIQVAIDGFRLLAARTGEYVGNDDALFEGREPNPKDAERPYPAKATVTVWRLVQGQRCSFTASARWVEFYPGDRQGFIWRKMPHVMLAKCAEAAALRKAFPAETSGLYVPEEMAQADREPQSTSPLQSHAEKQQTARDSADVPEDLDEAWAAWERLVAIATDEGHWEQIAKQTVKGRKFKPPAQDASLGTLHWYLGWATHELNRAREGVAF